VRGHISFAQTCRQIRSEYLHVPVYNIHTLEMSFYGSISFVQNVVAQQQFSNLLPRSGEWKLNINMAIPEDDERWVEGPDILLLLKAVTKVQAVNITPHFKVSLLHAKHGYFFKYFDEVFHPRSTWVSRLSRTFASVDQLLVRRTSWYSAGYLVIVPKPGLAIPAAEDWWRALERAFGSRVVLNLYTCFVHVDAAGEVGHGVDVVETRSMGPNAHRLKHQAATKMPPGFTGFVNPPR
jgi:hypothetical protein